MRKGTCVHFTGITNKKCKAGVEYATAFDSKTPGMFLRSPCIQLYVKNNVEVAKDRRGHEEIPCSLRLEPTPEQIEKADREFQQAVENHRLGLQLARKWRFMGVPDEDRTATFDCPACKTGKLRLFQSSHNGHVHGACSTESCLAWME